MPAGLANILDKKALSRLKSRFDAWWDGVEPAIEEDEAEAPAAPLPKLPTPTVAPSPRLTALGLLWGEDRVFAGDATADAALMDLLELAPDGALALVGPGLSAPVAAIAARHPGPIRVFEWRLEPAQRLAAEAARIERAEPIRVETFDLETGHLPRETFDALVSFDEFTFSTATARLAAQYAKAMKTGGRLVAEWYAGRSGRDLAPAFASAFAEIAVRPATLVSAAMTQSGFQILSDQDVTTEHLALGRESMRSFASRLDAAHGEVTPDALRELAWEAESWAARRRMLAEGRLERRRLLAVREDG